MKREIATVKRRLRSQKNLNVRGSDRGLKPEDGDGDADDGDEKERCEDAHVPASSSH